MSFTVVNGEGWLDVLGPLVKTLTPNATNAEDYAVILGFVAPGIAVPLHRHADRETFYVLEGVVEAYYAEEWHTVGAGELVDLAPNERHAWRNASAAGAKLLLVTTGAMNRFFLEAGRPTLDVPAPPQPEEIAAFLNHAEDYGYWIASFEENAAIGISL